MFQKNSFFSKNHIVWPGGLVNLVLFTVAKENRANARLKVTKAGLYVDFLYMLVTQENQLFGLADCVQRFNALNDALG